MPWQREADFKEVLDKAIRKGSKGAIATVQKIALEDMGQVCLMSICIIVYQVLFALLSLLLIMYMRMSCSATSMYVP